MYYYILYLTQTNMKKYYFKKIYWIAWFEVKLSQLFGLPEYEYGWWKARLNLIKKGEITE